MQQFHQISDKQTKRTRSLHLWNVFIPAKTLPIDRMYFILLNQNLTDQFETICFFFFIKYDLVLIKEDDGYGYCSLNPLDSSTAIWIGKRFLINFS
jgi:hypothetical protein